MLSVVLRRLAQPLNITRAFQNGGSPTLTVLNSFPKACLHSSCRGTLIESVAPSKNLLLGNKQSLTVQARRFLPTLNQVRRQKPRTKRKRSKPIIPANKRILLGPQRKGVCVKNVVRTPRKPNSAQRKCAVLRLNDGRLITAYIPGERANLQEHGVVLFRGGRVQDCPGLKYKIIRGVYDMN